jgi:hypothetical protein
MIGGRESRRPRPALGCGAIDDEDCQIRFQASSFCNELADLTTCSLWTGFQPAPLFQQTDPPQYTLSLKITDIVFDETLDNFQCLRRS